MFTYTNTYIHIYRHSNFFVFIIVYVYDVYGCIYHTCMGVHITHTQHRCGGQKTALWSQLSSLHVGSGVAPRSPGLCGNPEPSPCAVMAGTNMKITAAKACPSSYVAE